MSEQDIRWQQRFNNYTKALAQQRSLSKLEQQGLLSEFETLHGNLGTLIEAGDT